MPSCCKDHPLGIACISGLKKHGRGDILLHSPLKVVLEIDKPTVHYGAWHTGRALRIRMILSPRHSLCD